MSVFGPARDPAPLVGVPDAHLHLAAQDGVEKCCYLFKNAVVIGRSPGPLGDPAKRFHVLLPRDWPRQTVGHWVEIVQFEDLTNRFAQSERLEVGPGDNLAEIDQVSHLKDPQLATAPRVLTEHLSNS